MQNKIHGPHVEIFEGPLTPAKKKKTTTNQSGTIGIWGQREKEKKLLHQAAPHAGWRPLSTTSGNHFLYTLKGRCPGFYLLSDINLAGSWLRVAKRNDVVRLQSIGCWDKLATSKIQRERGQGFFWYQESKIWFPHPNEILTDWAGTC